MKHNGITRSIHFFARYNARFLQQLIDFIYQNTVQPLNTVFSAIIYTGNYIGAEGSLRIHRSINSNDFLFVKRNNCKCNCSRTDIKSVADIICLACFFIAAVMRKNIFFSVCFYIYIRIGKQKKKYLLYFSKGGSIKNLKIMEKNSH